MVANTKIRFAYQNLFEHAPSQYCCPHRSACAYINGTGSIQGSSRPNQSYQRPQQEIGTATLNDSPFGVGLTMRVNPSVLPRGNLVSLYLLWFRDGTCTGEELNGRAQCVLADVEDFSSNGMALFASGMVPLDASPLELSAFYTLPSAAWNLDTTLNYELQFRISDNGPYRSLPNEMEQNANFLRQWTSGENIGNYMVRYPPRKVYTVESH